MVQPDERVLPRLKVGRKEKSLTISKLKVEKRNPRKHRFEQKHSIYKLIQEEEEEEDEEEEAQRVRMKWSREQKHHTKQTNNPNSTQSKNANYRTDAESNKQSSSSPFSNSTVATEDKNRTHADRSNFFLLLLLQISPLFVAATAQEFLAKEALSQHCYPPPSFDFSAEVLSRQPCKRSQAASVLRGKYQTSNNGGNVNTMRETGGSNKCAGDEP